MITYTEYNEDVIDISKNGISLDYIFRMKTGWLIGGYSTLDQYEAFELRQLADKLDKLNKGK